MIVSNNKINFGSRLLLLVPLAVIQLMLLPMLFPAGLVVVDLLTIAVVINAVVLPLSQGLVIALLSALLIETHTIVPAGIYFCAYTVLVVVIRRFKGVVIWNLIGSWLVVFLLAELWLLALLTLAIDLSAVEIVPYLGKCLLAVIGTAIVGCVTRSTLDVVS